MSATMLTPDAPPPEDYYQNNCTQLFAFVLEHYEGLIDARCRDQLHAFLAAGNDAQRLFARLLTRKPLVRLDQLDYREVTDILAACEELWGLGLISMSALKPADQLLAMLRKDELLGLFEYLDKRQRKQEAMDQCLSRSSDWQLYNRIKSSFAWVSIEQPDVWQLALFLYFGDRQHDWASFVMRDLGMVRYEEVNIVPRFDSLEALEQELDVRDLSDLTYVLDEHPKLAVELYEALSQPQATRLIEARRTKSVLRLGHWYERQGASALALSVYESISVHPARERRVRIHSKLNQHAQAEQLMCAIAAAPYSEEERQFAERFGKRQAGYQPPTSVYLIDQAHADIEEQALELILGEADQPYAWGAHVENLLVRSLTGLLYWEVIFADIPGVFTNPFQTAPLDLYSGDFATARADVIDRVETAIANDTELAAQLRGRVEEKWGVANRLVSWPLFESIDLDDFLTAIPAAHIRVLCAFLIRHLGARRAGLPDLFIAYGNGQYEFVEVKGPTDQLQPGQRIWFKHFEQMGIPARVAKLKVSR